MDSIKSFTVKYKERKLRITSPLRLINLNIDKVIDIKAEWDTCAHISCISKIE